MSSRRGSPRRVVDSEGRTRCSKCGVFKDSNIENFKPSAMCHGGITATCRKCSAEYHRQWDRAHPEKAAKARERERARSRIRAREREIENSRRAPYHHRAKILRSGIKVRSRERNVPVDLSLYTVQYLLSWLQRQSTCECCGVTLAIERRFNGQKCDTSPSLDRIVPSLGYVAGNVALLCWRCNNLKRDATSDELMTIALWMKNLPSATEPAQDSATAPSVPPAEPEPTPEAA